MTIDRKPMPDLDDPLVAAFFAATKQERLVVQRCADCHFLRWPPGPLCPQCQSTRSDWTDIRPTGSLYSYAVYHRAMNPAFADDVPYTVGLIELDDGPRMYGRLMGDYDAGSVGCRMHARFVPASPDVTFVHWARD
jgi:uncharacterized OB-fold protein